MSEEPWNEEIYHAEETSRKNRQQKKPLALGTKIFTFLFVLFLIMTLAVIFIALYLSNGGSTTNSTEEFYHTTTSITEEGSSDAATAENDESSAEVAESSTEASSSETVASVDGETMTVESGEGEAAIAARAGITVEELENLNPEHMTTGSWFANPGDVVRIQ